MAFLVVVAYAAACGQARAPIPAPPAFDLTHLSPAAALHPRLFLTDRRLADLRTAIKTTHAAYWKGVQADADALVKAGPPPYQPAGDWEQLWQRPVGDALPTLAIAYLLTGDRTYLESAKAFATASCGYPTWGLGDCDGMDLATGHQLLGLSLLYDWCYGDLDEPTRMMIRQTLHRRADAMYRGVLAGKTFWGRTYLQNHLWVDGVGLTAAALVLADTPDARADAALWLGFTTDAMRHTFASLGDDGASQEGVPYWLYGVSQLLKYATLSRDLLGEDFFQTPWLTRTALFPLYLSVPRRAWSKDVCVVDLADSPRSHWSCPDDMLHLLAREYHDGHAQWYAREVRAAGAFVNPGTGWLNLLWYDPQIPATAPSDLPTLHHFTDLDIVSARTDWSGDESLVVFKCGPFIGHKAIHAFTYDPGGSHVHPDANHFVIFGGGQWLLRDDGYRPKMTASHNTLMIDGHGQFGEGKMWFDAEPALAAESEPRMTLVSSTPDLDRLTGDATTAYPAALGLTRYERHLLFIKPSTVIVIDDLAADHVADLDLRFHPECASAKQEGHVMTMAMHGVNFRAELLTPDGVGFTSEMIPTPDRPPKPPADLFTIHVRTRRAASLTAVAFSWAKDAAAPVVTCAVTADAWVFRVDGKQATFPLPKAR